MVRNCYTMIITKKVEIVYTQTLETNVASLLWLHWSTFFNLVKLQCKQTVVTVWFLHRLCQQNPRHWYDKRNMDCKNQRNRMLDRRTDHILSFFACFLVIQKLPNFVVKHVDLSWDFWHDMPCMGRRIDVNNEGDLDTRPSSLYWQIEPGVFLA